MALTVRWLIKERIIISPGVVRSIWLRHGLENRRLRLKRLEKQVRALEEAKEEKEARGEIRLTLMSF